MITSKFAVGDRVIATACGAQLPLMNGYYGKVTDVHRFNDELDIVYVQLLGCVGPANTNIPDPFPFLSDEIEHAD